MQKPAIPSNETDRQAALERYDLLDTAPEPNFDDITKLAAYICGVPMAFISLIDDQRQWFKSAIGLTQTETARDMAFCAHAINQPQDVMVIPNAQADPRFADNPLVTGDPAIRFYAGAPLITPDGYAIGTMCAADNVPRDLNAEQLDALRALGKQVVAQMELRLALQKLVTEQNKTESLLCNILPTSVAERLKHAPTVIADSFDAVSILFVDLVGFTQLASTLTPSQLVNLLNEIFSCFDEICWQHGVEKIKTIGDAYMAVAGIPQARGDHATVLAQVALTMRAAFHALPIVQSLGLHLRMGLHSGSVVAGVIGKHKFSYDLWGDTVNLASRMESHSLPDNIQVSAATAALLGNDFQLSPRGSIEIKGKGVMSTYWLVS